jgi:digeranylgeranylglycerophospholipid reductase
MINIIGGGPIGCQTASLLAKKNEVTLYEQKSKIGSPIQCTGILSQTINEIIKLKKDFIANKVYSTRIFAPNKKFIQIHFKKPNIIVWRNKFDQYFEEKALDNGVDIIYNSTYFEKNKIKNLKTKRTKTINPNILIGADGPLSKVRKIHSFSKEKHLQGVQALIKIKNDNVVDFYPHIGTYAWAVPESNNLLRVGVAAKKDTGLIFRDFVKRYKGKVVEWQSGIIPIHNPQFKTQKKNVFLIGDAAAQIKNTTGGGLIPGLLAAKALTKSINNKENYDSLWRKEVGKSLWTHYQIRKMMNKFTNKDWDDLINTFNKESLKEVLGSGSRDKPIEMIFKTLIKEPKLMLFAKKLF